jgi:dephospho-CoA kinase
MEIRRNQKQPVRKGSSKRAGSFCAGRTLVIGLTGGPASGKSTVAGMFEDLGAKVVSADAIVHEYLEPGTDVWKKIASEFGPEVLDADGVVDRKKLGQIVFRYPEKRSRLETIIHPPVLKRLAQEAEHFRAEGSGVLILEIPLLVETSSLRLVEKVLVVTAEQETQIDRLEKRYGISREEAILRIKSQLPMSEKVKVGDWVVSTEGTLRRTKEQVDRVWHAVQKLLA